MKTYEETLKSVLYKKAEREKQKKERRQRALYITAAVASVVLIASIPLGSVITAIFIKQAETPAATAALTEPPSETVSYIDSASVTAYPKSELPNGPGYSVYKHMDKDFKWLTVVDVIDAMIPVDGGFLCRIGACFGHVFTEDEDGYQLDIVVTDGENEICRETYFNEESLYGMTFIFSDLYMFIPDGSEYGEIHFCLNLLDGKTGTVTDYKESPFAEMCAGCAQKYRCLLASYGEKTPNVERERLLEEIDGSMHEYIYSFVDRLYLINESGEIKNEQLKTNYTAALTAYKADHPEEYAQIIEEFISNEAKTYDRYGNLKETPNYRHDPLEDIGK